MIRALYRCFTGAVLLVGFALFMATESKGRFANLVVIGYDYAIGVAIVGLVVNGISVTILGGPSASVSPES